MSHGPSNCCFAALWLTCFVLYAGTLLTLLLWLLRHPASACATALMKEHSLCGPADIILLPHKIFLPVSIVALLDALSFR